MLYDDKIDDRVTEYIKSTKHPLYEWDVSELIEECTNFEVQQEEYDFKLIVAYCIYNEEDFLEESLNNCLEINDLDGIHILDGAWVGGGVTPWSTDRTLDIISKFKKNNPQIKVVCEDTKSNELWKSQGEKRSHQLNRIEKLWGKAYMIIKDGDETISFNSGRQNIWLKQELAGMFPAVGILKSYAWGKDTSMIGARFIPTGQGIHYHTDKSMIIHDENCNIICDYNIDKNFVKNNICWDYDKMFYINRWNIRNHDRQVVKDKYASTQTFGERELEECKGKQTFI